MTFALPAGAALIGELGAGSMFEVALVELEGNWDSRRMVILEFPSLERAVSWYHSPEYQHAIEARQGAAILHMVALEGNTLDLAAADPEARG